MDIYNLWTETDNECQNKLNIVKSWLCNGCDGQTYPIHDKVFEVDFDKIDKDKWDISSFNCEEKFDGVVGFKHDYKVDDPKLDEIANRIIVGLTALTEDIYAHPEKYFEPKTKLVVCRAHHGISCDNAVHDDNRMCDVCLYVGECPFKG